MSNLLNQPPETFTDLDPKSTERASSFPGSPSYRQPAHIQDIFDSAARLYSRDEPKFRDDLISRPLVVELSRHLGLHGDILDVGCGDGHISRIVSSFARSVKGVDISRAMIETAAEKSDGYGNVDYVREDFLNPHASFLRGKYDLALCVFAFCCVESREDLELAFSNINRALKRAGTLILQIPAETETLSATESSWIREARDSNRASGDLVVRHLRSVDGNWVKVARFYHAFGDYLNAFERAGFEVDTLIEPMAGSGLLIRYPSLWHEAGTASSLVLILKKK